MEVLYPTGNGNYSEFDGSDGNSTDNYLLVDEPNADDDTTYVEFSTVSERDSYSFCNLGETVSGEGVLAVQLLNKVKKEGGTEARTAKSFVRISSTDYDSATEHTLVDGTYTTEADLLVESPATTAQWTESEANALEAGIKVES